MYCGSSGTWSVAQPFRDGERTMEKRSPPKPRGEKLPAALIDILNRRVDYVPESYLRYKALEKQMEQERGRKRHDD